MTLCWQPKALLYELFSRLWTVVTYTKFNLKSNEQYTVLMAIRTLYGPGPNSMYYLLEFKRPVPRREMKTILIMNSVYITDSTNIFIPKIANILRLVNRAVTTIHNNIGVIFVHPAWKESIKGIIDDINHDRRIMEMNTITGILSHLGIEYNNETLKRAKYSLKRMEMLIRRVAPYHPDHWTITNIWNGKRYRPAPTFNPEDDSIDDID